MTSSRQRFATKEHKMDRFRVAKEQTDVARAKKQADEQAKEAEAERMLDGKYKMIVGFLDRLFEAVERESDAFGTGKGQASRTLTTEPAGLRTSTISYKRKGPADGFEAGIGMVIDQHPQNPQNIKIENGSMRITVYPTDRPGRKSLGTFHCSEIPASEASESDVKQFLNLLESLAAGSD